MKKMKYILSTVVLLASSISLHAQSYYDANRLVGQDLDGTARFVGMGGAMSALGGDISVMGVNPAGIGIYRSNDANVSFGFMSANTKSNYPGTKESADKNSFQFSNVGFVFALKQGDYTPLRFVNFGFNARKVKSFDRDMSARGTYNYSQTQQFAQMVNDNSAAYGFLSPDVLLDKDAFLFSDVPWLGAMAYEAYLLPMVGAEEYGSYFDPARHRVAGRYDSRERGGIYSYDFNIAFNLYDRIYLGATIGAYDVNYKRTSTYSEVFLTDDGKDDGNYSLDNYYKIEGSGVDFKLGAIVRPFESSPLRIGLSVSTPIFYNLTEYNMAYLSYDTYNPEDDQFHKGITYPQQPWGNDMVEMEGRTDYKVRTPWKYNVSLGYTIGSKWALGAEYEYMDYSSTKMKLDNGYKLYKEDEMGASNLKGVNTFRIGAEYRFVPEFSFRLGYNYIGASTSNQAYKVLAIDGIRTDTEYSNGKEINNYTMGFGYRGKSFYADMAYKYQTQKENFYAFDNTEMIPTKITNDRHHLMLTLGMRF